MGASDILSVLKHHFWEELEMLVEMDTKGGLPPQKFQRAGPVLIASIPQWQVDKVHAIAKAWKVDGPPIAIQMV